eukprot:3208402-Alexandrium_andersonii.AAC.1
MSPPRARGRERRATENGRGTGLGLEPQRPPSERKREENGTPEGGGALCSPSGASCAPSPG